MLWQSRDPTRGSREFPRTIKPKMDESMAEIVNLRRARKARDRQAAADRAAENRRLHGRDKATRATDAAAEADRSLAAARLDGHRRRSDDAEDE